MDVGLIVAGIAVGVWLLIIVYRRDIRKRLPWFACYVLWELLASCIQLILLPINRRVYANVYWWMETVEIVLTVAAVRESFLRIFRGFTKMPWFRWTVSGVIGAIVAYSAWRAFYHPPLHTSRLVALVFGSEFLFRWGILGIALLTTVLSVLLQEPMNTREDAVVTGFGIASFGFLIYVLSRSLFGTKYIFLTRYAPSVGYFGAVFLWIWVFLRRVEGFGFKELGIGPEDLLKLIRRYREDLKRIRGTQ